MPKSGQTLAGASRGLLCHCCKTNRGLPADGTSARNRLGAFIRYDRIEYSDASHLITSIAYSLGMFDRRIGAVIFKVLQSNRHVLGLSADSAKEQFDLLLRRPLESLPDLALEGPIVIIIDGLDESDITKEMLAVLFGGFGSNLPFMRLLVFSRPIERISHSFHSVDPAAGAFQFALDATSEQSKHVKRDVEHFIDIKFGEIYKAEPPGSTFKITCEERDAVDKLAQRASGLFIWAAAACSFISANPNGRMLDAILGSNLPKNATDSLNILYRTALNTIVFESELDDMGNIKPDKGSVREDLKEDILRILGTVLVAKTPPGMTAVLLDNIVLTPNEDTAAQVILEKLGSVLRLPSTEDDGFIEVIHKSFDDFLKRPLPRQDGWFIDIEAHQRKLAKQCLSRLIKFLESWVPDSAIPSYIENYAVVGPVWHIKCFGVQDDINDIRTLFEELLPKWLQVAFMAGKHCDLLSERIEVLLWVNRLKDVDNSFRLLMYRACQHAEKDLIPKIRDDEPVGPCGAKVHWHDILEYSPHLMFGGVGVFSTSADSQMLVAATEDHTSLAFWNISVPKKPALISISSFFDPEESLEDPQYNILGCVVTRSVVVRYPYSRPQAHCDIIGRCPDGTTVADQSATVLISICDIRTPQSCYHYLFEGLKTYKVLLYVTSIIIVDMQAMALVRIDVNTTDRHVHSTPGLHSWIRVAEGDALQREYSPSWANRNSLHHSFSRSELDSPLWERYSYDSELEEAPGRFLVVSKDGSTLAHLFRSDRSHRNSDIVLRCWSTTTGDVLSTTANFGEFREHRLVSLRISASGTTCLLITRESFDNTSLHIVPSSSDNGIEYDVIYLEGIDQASVAFLPDERRIAYTTNGGTSSDMVIRDIRDKHDIFRHPFPYDEIHDYDERPLDIVVTPDGKTLITVHPWVIRTWHIEAL
ncbi:uncharacterized protein EV420DRAFT_1649549 [Desarmillaria tabescens]|uniref:Nephrocystin 3-like N-terminal domain-containing protein n=1 Tax=Armillaria tabescens TaxID=1929756 RepID=A0AA39JIZ5_ARMTA|nr:uncharacterized protein EV420DRAFT_1649549 [Desarmillaria tabescens]KAK0442800.1 hypothetical protein EV420DRAFT_1649549 [Desarmillaria tabescens]